MLGACLRHTALVLAIVKIGLASSDCAASSEDETSLLQVWSDLNPREAPQFNFGAQAAPAPAMFMDEASALDRTSASIERQLQQVQDHFQPARDRSFSSLQESSEVASLRNTVADLRVQNEAQAGQLNNARQQQRMSTNAVDHAKQQLETEIKNTQKAWQNEHDARESERKAWKAAAEQAEKDRALEERLKHEDEEVKKMVQQREMFAKKLAQLEDSAEKVKTHERKAWELSMLQAEQSEKKAWKVAKVEAEKAVSERKLKETLLTQAKTELGRMKSDVTNVQAQAADELKKEVQEVDQKVVQVKQQANDNLKKASAQLQREHEQVESVVKWASKVKQEADAKMQYADSARQQVASNVNWAAVAQREAARASAAIEEVEKLKATSESKGASNQTGSYGF
jgi:DNA repair exonuclease SbcCD ATPase subunit